MKHEKDPYLLKLAHDAGLVKPMVKAIARLADLSESHVSHVFATAYGVSSDARDAVIAALKKAAAERAA